METPVKMDQFGKDHWSTFGYLETTMEFPNSVKAGSPERERMRCHPTRHPQYAHRGTRGWEKGNATRLHLFFGTEAIRRREGVHFILDHDDWDCLDDCEAAGLIENIGTGLNRKYRMTDAGHKVANALKEHKRRGGYFANFVPSKELVS